MKKIICMVSLACILAVFCSVPSPRAEETPEEPDNLYARSAVLMDADSGRVLFGKEADTVRPMASTTKIMTCILTLEHMEEGQTAAVSGNAAGQPKVKLGVSEGEEYYINDLLYSLMLESHNDSAVVIAEEIGGSVEGFAAMMNEKAEELGCTHTHFVTPNGLDSEDDGGAHGTTAAELARIMRYCITLSPEREAFLAITQTRSYQFTDTSGKRSFSVNNHNAFLDMMDGALSGKTGFTGGAGYCYVGALERDGRTFIVALLACGWPNNRNYKWSDTRKLMEYGIANYAYRDVWEEPQIGEIPVTGGVSEEDRYAADTTVKAGVAGHDRELKVLLRADEDVEVRTEVADTLAAPVAEGEKAGRITYLLDGREIAGYDIVTLGSVRERDVRWCFYEMLGEICL